MVVNHLGTTDITLTSLPTRRAAVYLLAAYTCTCTMLTKCKGKNRRISA